MSPNIYIELELFLDPPVVNPEALTLELKTKRIPEWNKKVNANPKYSAFTEKANKYLKEDLATLGLKKLAEDACKEKFDALDHAIKEYERDGILETSEFKNLLNMFPCFKEETIKSRLHLGITEGFKPPEKPKSLDDEGTPISEMENITNDLKIIENGKYNDFYELLGMNPASTTKALYEAAKEAGEKNRRVTSKTAAVDAKNRLFGKAANIFKDNHSRKKYDIALRRSPFDKLCRKSFDLRTNGKMINEKDYELSISEAQRCGYNAKEAEWMVYDYYCNKRKCSPPRLKFQYKPVQQCAACFCPNEIDVKVCSQCGVPLKLECPECHAESSFGVGYCRCGYAIGDMSNAITAVKSAKQCLAEDKIDDAKALFRKAVIYWHDYPAAAELRKQIDIIENEKTERLKKEQAEKEKRKREASALESKIRNLVAKKYFFEAEKEIDNLNAVCPDSLVLKNEGKQIENTLNIVRNDLTKLANCKTIREKTDLCEGIVEKTVDCPEANTALENFPPLPPSHLTVKELPTGFQLSWQPPPSKRPPQFIVVRKKDGVPVSAQDGEPIAKNLTSVTFTDSSLDVGTIYGYAVFSQRGEQFDTAGCKTNLLQMTGEVQNLQALPNDSAITLIWTPFHNAAVRVFRYIGNSTDGNGKEIYQQKSGNVQDNGLTNGQVYTYKVQSVFKNPEGKEIVTDGQIVSCKPMLPPPAVTDLKAEPQPNGDVLLHWTPPDRGTLFLFAAKNNPPVNGVILQCRVEELVKRFGEPIPITETQSTIRYNAEGGISYVFPITYQEGLAVAGSSVTVSKIDTIKNLHLYHSGVQWYLCWDWAEGIDKVLLIYRNDKIPEGKNDESAVRKVISRSQYAKEGSVTFPAGRDYYFALYSLLEQDGNLKFSKPVYRQTLKTIIRYSLSFRKSTRDEPECVLQIRAENAETLPAFIVKKTEEKIPLTRNEGIPIAFIAACPRKSGSILIPKKYFDRDSFIRLFVKDTEDAVRYIIKEPPKKNLELYEH